jgi:hypothetical protein
MIYTNYCVTIMNPNYYRLYSDILRKKETLNVLCYARNILVEYTNYLTKLKQMSNGEESVHVNKPYKKYIDETIICANIENVELARLVIYKDSTKPVEPLSEIQRVLTAVNVFDQRIHKLTNLIEIMNATLNGTQLEIDKLCEFLASL